VIKDELVAIKVVSSFQSAVFSDVIHLKSIFCKIFIKDFIKN